MLDKLKRRMGNRGGFTLAEMLMAVLILAMVSGVVAAGVPLAANAMAKVVDAANAQVLLSTTMTCLRSELETATDVRVDGDYRTISYRNEAGNLCTLSVVTDGAQPGVYLREDGCSDPRLLVSQKAANEHLYAVYEVDDGHLTGNKPTDGVLLFEELTIYKRDETNGDRSLVRTDSFAVRIISAMVE